MFSQVSVCPQSASWFTARPSYGAVGTHPTRKLSCVKKKHFRKHQFLPAKIIYYEMTNKNPQKKKTTEGLLPSRTQFYVVYTVTPLSRNGHVIKLLEYPHDFLEI